MTSTQEPLSAPSGCPLPVLVMPFCNLEAVVPPTIRRLWQAFERAEIPIERAAVGNGSTDAVGSLPGSYQSPLPR